MIRLRTAFFLAASLALFGACVHEAKEADSAAARIAGPQRLDGQLANGAYWAADVPENWNGSLLVYGRGYGGGATPNPQTAPPNVKDWLLANGYALASSSYSTTGWAVAESPADLIDALDAFIAAAGKPKRTIVWGSSMGGLTTIAVSEKYGERIDGAISMCGSVSGAVPMLNTALDGAFAFRTLLAPDSDIRIVNVDDDRANTARVRAALDEAMKTPQGRARVGLSGVLAQIPGWTNPADPEPAAADHAAQLVQVAKGFAMGVFLPRTDQEARAGGVTSWNTGVDYRDLLERSGRAPFVRALYAEAGLNLDADIAALNTAPRISADPAAVAYMRTAYSPTGKLKAPTLSMHETGDGMTIASLETALGDAAAASGQAGILAQAYVHQAGHCRFTAPQTIAALKTIEHRLDTGRWAASAEDMNRLAAEIEPGTDGHFVNTRPATLLRACNPVTGACVGEPVEAPSRLPADADLSRLRTSLPEPPGPGTPLGPYPVTVEVAPNLPTHTIYYPTDLSGFSGRNALPVLSWGNGGCRNDGQSFRQTLTKVASHGYFVIVPGAFISVPNLPSTTGAQLLEGVSWAETVTAGNGKFKGKIAADKVAVMGQSCGGLMTAEAAHDVRVDTIGVINSGILPDGTDFASTTSTKATLKTFHTPALYLNGGENDVAYPNANDDFERLTDIPVFYGVMDGAGHGATHRHKNGGRFAEVITAWLDWRLKGDAAAGRMFAGPDCGLCIDPAWTIRRKNLN